MSDGTYRRLAEAILVAHQRKDIGGCLCGWAKLGRSHAAHVAEILEVAGALRDRPPSLSLPIDTHPARDEHGICGNCGAKPNEHHRDGCWTSIGEQEQT